VLEEIRLGLAPDATPSTHADVVAAVRGALAPAGLDVPDVAFAPAPARTVAAPTARTR
jgi:hypothetical protein